MQFTSGYAPKSNDKVSHPKLLDSVSNVQKIICGRDHCFAITNDFQVLAWGNNNKGQLGIYLEQNTEGVRLMEEQFLIYNPTVISALIDKRIDNIATGANHSFAWSSETGEVYAWGSGAYGKLGFGSKNDEREPSLLECFTEASSVGMRVREIVCGDEHSLAVLEQTEEEENDHRLFVWGCARGWQLGLEGDVSEDVLEPHVLDPDPWDGEIRNIAACHNYSSGVTAAGVVYTWGSGEFGRLGYETETKQQRVPRHVSQLLDIQKVSLGIHHAMAISTNGLVFSWGRGINGQLGHDEVENEAYPKLVKVLSQKKIVDISCGENHTLAVSDLAEIYSWGAGQFGQLGHGVLQRQNIPLKINGLDSVKVVQVSAGKRHSVALNEKGQVYVWGCNDFCQLGLKTITGVNGQRSIPPPIDTSAPGNDYTFSLPIWTLDKSTKSTTNSKGEKESKVLDELTEENTILANRVKDLELRYNPNKQKSQQQMMYDLTSQYVGKIEEDCSVRDNKKNEAILRNIKVEAVAKEYKQKVKDANIEDQKTISFCVEMFERICELKKKANYAVSQP